MATQMIVRIDPELKEKLVKVARQEGKTASQAVRELVESYVKERDISAYIGDLWDRIGAEFKRKGITQAKIDVAIKQARAEKRRK